MKNDTGLGCYRRCHLQQVILPVCCVTAVSAAVHNNINLAIAVAVGSSLQIALFLTPAMVVVGWCIGQPFTVGFEKKNLTVLSFRVDRLRPNI